MIVSSMSIALGGMQAATLKLEDAARRVATAGVTPALAQDGPAGTTPISPGLDGSNILQAQGSADGDLVNAVIDAKLAEISYKASIKVFAAADKMFDALLDITS